MLVKDNELLMKFFLEAKSRFLNNSDNDLIKEEIEFYANYGLLEAKNFLEEISLMDI